VREIDKAHDEFIEAAVWHGSLEPAAAILAVNPAIATHSIHAAAILGDAPTVRQFIARDPASATEKGGPKGCDALTYLCFSTYLRLEPAARTSGFLDAATALLDAGADPNTGFYAGEERVQSEWKCALYGAAGVAHHPELTKLLVERGADPNDGEVAYHSPETLDNRTLKVLVDSGKLTQDSLRLILARKMNWHDDGGFAWLLDHGVDPNAVHWKSRPLEDALAHGCPIHYFEQLLDHGADPALPSNNGRSTFAGAARMARVDVLDLLERRGFAVKLDGDDAFLAACARADEAAARRMVAADPELVGRVESRDPTLLIEYAGADNTAAVRLLLDLGFDIGAARTEPRWSRGVTALHEATSHCRLETVKLLIDRGAPLAAKHAESGRTPGDVALLCITEQSEWTPDQKSIPIARALLEAGAPFNEKSMMLATAICLNRAADIERLSPTATRDDKQRALAAAAFNANVEGLRKVISLGVELDATDAGLEHAAPLHNAVSSGSLDTVKTLVEAGASLDTKDLAYHLRPLDWAEWYAKHGREPREYAAIDEYLHARTPSS
jgi:ankyrin repeat protein